MCATFNPCPMYKGSTYAKNRRKLAPAACAGACALTLDGQLGLTGECVADGGGKPLFAVFSFNFLSV